MQLCYRYSFSLSPYVFQISHGIALYASNSGQNQLKGVAIWSIAAQAALWRQPRYRAQLQLEYRQVWIHEPQQCEQSNRSKFKLHITKNHMICRGLQSIYLHRSGPLLENDLDRAKNLYGRYGFLVFTAFPYLP